MKRSVRRALSALLSVLMLASLLAVPAGAAGETHTVWVVGDSTVCHYGDEEDQGFYYKRMGYGDKIGEYVTSGYTVKNLGASGRSSKSFPNEGTNGSKANYDEMIAGMKAGDILIIGFGHNDEKTDAERFTDPKGDYQTEGSFAKSLYDNYVKPAKDKGAIPVLCTPIVRHPGIGKSWGNSSLHVANGGSYPEAVIKLGQDTDTAVVDLTTLTKELYETLDTAEANSSAKLHSWSQDKADSMDSTHINKYGAKWVAYTLAKDIVNSTDANVSAELKAAFTLAAGEPTAEDLAAAATPGWTPPVYAAPKLPEEKSAIWENYVAGSCTFYGTAFGSLGGNPTTDNYTMGTDAQGNMQFTIKKQKGKVASAEEGFLMYFVPVPAGKNFTLKATATVDGFVEGATNPNQAAFGLMARDGIWIDQNDKALKSDYVVAGTFGNGGANCFRRKSGTLEKPASMSVTPTVGTSYDLTLQGTNDGYTCIFDDQPAQSGGYDFKLTTMDADYVYVGMFVARSMSVTFSEIYLEVDGEVLCNTAPPFAFSVDGWNFTDASGAPAAEAVAGGKLASITGDRVGREPEAMALVAVYDDQGKMTGLKSVAVKDGEIPVDLPMNAGEVAKVFVINRNDVSPFTAAFSSADSATPPAPANP